MPSYVSTEYVTTDGVARDDRFDHWAKEMSQVFGGLDTRPVAAGAFHGTATCDALGQLLLGSISAGPLRVRRTERLAARSEDDHYKVALQVAGTCVVEQDGVYGALGPGDLVICDTTRPYAFRYDTAFRTVLMLVPRAMLPVRPEAVRGLTARPLTGESGVAAVVGPFLRSLGEQARTCAGPAASGLADGAASLMTALVSERLDRAAPAEPGHAMMLRIRAHIDSRLPDPGLTPDSIAEAHGISRRYLFKLFAAEDLTVAGWIRTRRLERCARDLSSPAAVRQSIGMIAARWGLLDGRHFSRVFKTAYGCTPRDFRRRAFALAEQAPHGRIGTRTDG
ncbi:AraC-like ligand-binding domain-containing protein [Streptomyces endophyticus]|uniref:Helix-turn-helix domain-containing protein n=1 Tax=Streptomyces endophyticus TaxID=714166 RepID=A0ABU6FHZ7_9ACTN|nr:helix-turn-helix domain-containing protein [Streptomyces endophyticus]MEB8342402.1 helix-turn-helix domain-containing protein [Streptomyces endophyticus]